MQTNWQEMIIDDHATPRDAQAQLKAIIMHLFGRIEAIIDDWLESAVTPASGVSINWQEQGVNDLHLIGTVFQ